MSTHVSKSNNVFPCHSLHSTLMLLATIHCLCCGQWKLFDLKHQIALDLTQPYDDFKSNNKTDHFTKVTPCKCKDPPEAVCQFGEKAHYLLKNEDDKLHTCFLCSKVKSKRMRTIFSCVEYNKSFHVECFS